MLREDSETLNFSQSQRSIRVRESQKSFIDFQQHNHLILDLWIMIEYVGKNLSEDRK